jgi:hypothetical protein
MPSLPMLAFTGVFLVLGLGMTTLGANGLRKWRLMSRMTPNRPTVESGLQEFEGTAHSVEGTVTAPFTGTQSLIAESKVERYDSTGEGSNWDTVTKETDAVPFEVEHDSGVVAVEPDDASHLLTEEFQTVTQDPEELPPEAQQYAEENLSTGSTVELGPVDLGGRRYRFTEKRLDDGEAVYVLGPADRSPGSIGGSEAKLAITSGGGGWRQQLFGDPFVISDTGEEQAKSRQLKQAGFLLALGLVFAGAGVAVFVLA